MVMSYMYTNEISLQNESQQKLAYGNKQVSHGSNLGFL